MRYLIDEDDDNPILSVVNMIDIFLALVALLLIALAKNPINVFSADDVTVIKNAGKPNMEMVVKKGEKMTHYKASEQMGEGQGEKAGITYRLSDGSLVYVPEAGATP